MTVGFNETLIKLLWQLNCNSGSNSRRVCMFLLMFNYFYDWLFELIFAGEGSVIREG